MKAKRKAQEQAFAGPPKPPERVIAERILDCLTIPWRYGDAEYFYIHEGKLVNDDTVAVLRIGISRTGFALPEISALTREVEELLANAPHQNSEGE